MSKAPPHFDAPWDVADAGAIQALARGDASPEMQKRALEWIVNVAAMTYQPTFMQGDRESAFAEGRRFVGLQVVKLTRINLNVIRKAKPNA